MTTTRLVFPERRRVELRREPLVDPAPTEVQVEIDYSLVSSGTERVCYAGDVEPGSHWAEWLVHPFHPGYSAAGRVIASGSLVAGSAAGQRVALLTSHRLHANVAADECFRIPEGVSTMDAAWVGLSATIQIGIARADMRPGDAVAVLGAGAVGQLVARWARLAGANVTMFSRSGPRLDVAKASGFDTRRLEIPSGRSDGADGFDVAFDTTGDPTGPTMAAGLARDFGRVVLIGDPPHPSRVALPSDVLLRGLTVVGAHFNHAGTHDLPSYPALAQVLFAALGRREMTLTELVTHVVRPADAPAVYARLADHDPTMLAVLFDWTGR